MWRGAAESHGQQRSILGSAVQVTGRDLLQVGKV